MDNLALKSALTPTERQWLSEQLHPSCRDVVSSDCLTDYYFDVVKTLGTHDGKIYAKQYAGMGYEIIAKRDSVRSPVWVTMISYNDTYKAELYKFTHGYRHVTRQH